MKVINAHSTDAAVDRSGTKLVTRVRVSARVIPRYSVKVKDYGLGLGSRG